MAAISAEPLRSTSTDSDGAMRARPDGERPGPPPRTRAPGRSMTVPIGVFTDRNVFAPMAIRETPTFHPNSRRNSRVILPAYPVDVPGFPPRSPSGNSRWLRTHAAANTLATTPHGETNRTRRSSRSRYRPMRFGIRPIGPVGFDAAVRTDSRVLGARTLATVTHPCEPTSPIGHVISSVLAFGGRPASRGVGGSRFARRSEP